jgi:5-methylthioribose kinase
LIRERKTLTKDEEKIREARRAYRDGIKKAWDIYTQDNLIVNEAKKTLDSAIDEAYKLCLPEHGERMAQTEYEQATKLYFKTLCKVHRKFADTIGQVWGVFMKDIETYPRLTKKNTI